MTGPVSVLNLIVTGDDLGYCEERTRGILRCWKAGRLSGASLIVNMENSQQAAREAKEANMPLGLHLNITEGSPVCVASDGDTATSSITRRDSRGGQAQFLGKFAFAAKAMSGGVREDDVVREVEAQIARFEELVGTCPTHVDSHQHSHVFVAGIMGPLFQRHGVTSTRIPGERYRALMVPPPEIPARFPDADDKADAGTRAWFYDSVSRLAEKSRKIYAAAGLKSTTYFTGVWRGNSADSRSTAALCEALDDVMSEILEPRQEPQAERRETEGDPRPKIPLDPEIGRLVPSVEFMLHPGYVQVGGGDDFSRSQDRVLEMEALCAPDFGLHLELRRPCVVLVSWDQL
ncbi:carbohydrate deacetylase [Pelomyxa schiedti]|nr:carbohydrate deacetylase [Pelomyxa schiedti]